VTAELKPGKGLRLNFQPALSYILDEFDKLEKLAEEFEGRPSAFMLALKENGWTYYEDKFGDCCYIESSEGARDVFRITVVLTTKGELKLDLRNWYVG
jgi:hypothetical protein